MPGSRFADLLNLCIFLLQILECPQPLFERQAAQRGYPDGAIQPVRCFAASEVEVAWLDGLVPTCINQRILA